MIATAVVLSVLALVPTPQSFFWSDCELPTEGYRLRVKGGKTEIEAADVSAFYKIEVSDVQKEQKEKDNEPDSIHP